MATTTASATATIVKAAEHVLIDEAEAVAKTLATKNTADIKSIVIGVAKETLAASEDSPSTIVENIEDGAKALESEVVKGAEAVIHSVEEHPEVIAEGAFALGVGVISLVQPELVVGSVAFVGKMAADATEQTINQTVIESGSSVVKDISKSVNEETAELAAQDAAEKAKSAALEAAKDGSKAGVEATVDVKSAGNVATEVTTSYGMTDGEAAGKKVTAIVSGDATATVREITPGAAPGPILSEETVQTSARSTSEIKDDSNNLTTAGPSVVVTINNLTGDKKAAFREGSVTAVVEKPAATKAIPLEPSTEQGPVAVSNVDVEAFAREVAREMIELEAAESTQTGEKILESSVWSEAESSKSLGSAAAKVEADVKKLTAEAEAKAKEADSVPLAKLKTSEKAIAVEKISAQEEDGASTDVAQEAPHFEPERAISKTEEVPALAQLGLVHSDTVKNKETSAATSSTVIQEPRVDKVVPEPLDSAPVSTSKDREMSDPVPAAELEPTSSKSEDKTLQKPELTLKPVELQHKPKDAPPTEHKESESDIAGLGTKTLIEAPSKKPLASSPSDAAAHAITYASLLEAHSQIAQLHESNQLMHQKALLAITKALAKSPAAPATPTIPVETEPVATADNQIVLASANTPSLEVINKRMSVFGSIGWLFGAGSGSAAKKHKKGKSIATSTPASVPSAGVESPAA